MNRGENTPCAGWIKISRELPNHWIWQDAERLKWWLDLLLLAAWEDKKVLHDSHLFTLKRGQMIASISFLAERWGRSKPTIIAYLKMLEEDYMIQRKVLYRLTPIITICNYDKYQLRVDTLVDTQIDTLVDTQIDTLVDTSKEIKEIKEIKENIDVVDNARTREEEFLQRFFSPENQNRLDVLCKSNNTDLATLKMFALEILNEWQLSGKIHADYSDAARHLINQLRIKCEYARRKAVADAAAPKSRDQKRQALMDSAARRMMQAIENDKRRNQF